MSKASFADFTAAIAQKRKEPPSDLFASMFNNNTKTEKPQINKLPKMSFNDFIT